MIESAARFDPTKLYVIAEETVIMRSVRSVQRPVGTRDKVSQSASFPNPKSGNSFTRGRFAAQHSDLNSFLQCY